MCVYQYHYLIMCVNFHPTIIALLRRLNSTTLKDRTEQLRDGGLEQQHAEAIVSIAGREMPEMSRTDLGRGLPVFPCRNVDVAN